MIKKEIRVLGIDDAPFRKGVDEKVLVVGVVYRGGNYLDGVISDFVTVDGDDATDMLISMIKRTKHRGQLQMIMIKGLAVGGFNVIDIKRLWHKTKLPVLVVMKRLPKWGEFFDAMKNAPNWKEKLDLVEKAGVITKSNHLYIQSAGLSDKDAFEVIKISCTHGKIPEPLRAAHIIASGIVEGESRGRA
jgi:endonuclease V-like protein UPF0215 family